MLLGSEYWLEQYEIAKQSFFEEYFDYGNDKETLDANYKKSIELFFEKYMHANNLVDNICYGEIVDDALVLQALQEMLFAREFAVRFREDLFGTAKLLNPESIEPDKDSTQNAMRGNQYLGSFATSNDPLDYEVGRWLLLNAIG